MTAGIVLLVAYGNMEEVDAYIEHVRCKVSTELTFAVCDNSPRAMRSRHEGDPSVTIVARPDNPGYLEGALVAMRARRAQVDADAPWIILSNTDLRFETSNLLSVLSSYDSARPLILAPRITEGPGKVEKNPHVVSRRSVRRLRANGFVASTTLTAMAYQAASLVLHAARRGSDIRRRSDSWAATYPAGTEFYSPYGAMIIFSSGFFQEGGLPENVPLLSEEYFIAESALAHSAPIIYEPAIHVHHEEHATTGPRLTLRRARLTSVAFKAISNDASRRRREDV